MLYINHLEATKAVPTLRIRPASQEQACRRKKQAQREPAAEHHYTSADQVREYREYQARGPRMPSLKIAGGLSQPRSHVICVQSTAAARCAALHSVSGALTLLHSHGRL